MLRVLGEKTRGHLDPVFMQRFSRALKNLRTVFAAPSAQPFVLAGSGTLAMEQAVANLTEPGDSALVVNTGYFSDRIATMLQRHGATVTQVKAAPGHAPPVEEVERALAGGKYKLLTITHVDTSTAVLAPVEAYAKAAKKHGALVVVDGVCSVGGETLNMEEWGVDVTFTASQKALGAPPGLSVLLAGPRAMETWRARKHPVASVYLDFGEWLPIHEAYEALKPAYFATPPVNLISALDESLTQIVTETMAARLARHVETAATFRAAWKRLGLKMLPISEDVAAHTLSAVYYPQGRDAALLKAVAAQGVVLAGGLHPDLKTQYFRVGHMGAVSKNDIAATIAAIEYALK